MAVMVVSLLIFLVGFCGQYYSAQGQVYHVVGGERGWHPASQIQSWSSGRVFRVGDHIWFLYSAAQENYVVELRSKEALESCDISNPIRMYTDGIDKVMLDGEGPHYFASSSVDGCKNGLKLHVDVLPQIPKPITAQSTADMVAAAPLPSASARAGVGATLLLWPCAVAMVGYLI
ncbi:hypothetical protein Syun_026879 [Stephania yunnanensis]|uniref:Phytocyanin domain-containing protein n=1 Tax=Stephania yunnanensis TaxID=152371 RepID=A0AAP0EK24_9MAGN